MKISRNKDEIKIIILEESQMSKKGIDVSVHQGNIDWNKVKDSGIEFAVIRDGYGRESPNQVDKRFHTNIKNAQNSGIHCGVYHYSYAINSADAVKEAQFCLKNIKDYKLEYPVAFDIEDKSMIKLGKRVLTDICKAFCGTIEQAGYYSIIYTNPNWLKNYLFADELLPSYDLWLAQWGASKPSYACGIWQTSETGKVDGISGNVDINIAYKDYKKIMEDNSLNGFTKGNPEPAKNYTEYKVKSGDSLWEIAQNTLGNGSRYKEIQNINGLSSDVIHPGQTLKIPK